MKKAIFLILFTYPAVWLLQLSTEHIDFRNGIYAQEDDDWDEEEPEEEPEEEDEETGEKIYYTDVPTKVDPGKYKVLPFEDLWSSNSDIAPCISPDGKYIIFQSNRDIETRFSLYETFLKKNKWAKPKLIILDKRAKFEGLPFFSGREGLIYYTAIGPENYQPKGSVDIPADIWVTRRQKRKWGKPTHLLEPVNTEYEEVTPWVSPDGRFLYFASNRPGGYGGFDIWISEYRGDKWSQPVNAGPAINTGFNELYPRLNPDGRILYYSSNREGGVGGYDIYFSKLRRKTWSHGENSGSFINTPVNDYMNSIPASGDYLILSRGRSGSEKIYKVIPVPDFLKPKKVTIARIVVVDQKTKIPLPFSIELKDLRSKLVTLQKKYTPKKKRPYKSGDRIENDSIRQYFTREGLFIPLKAPGKYNIMITVPGYLFADENIILSKDSPTELEKVIPVSKIRKGNTVRLRNLYFVTNKAILKGSSQGTLYRIARFLKKNPELIIEVQGHTARDPNKERALKLSQERARAVADALVGYGIAPERLRIRGYGDTKPVAPNNSKENMAKNRRVEFKVVDIKKTKRKNKRKK